MKNIQKSFKFGLVLLVLHTCNVSANSTYYVTLSNILARQKQVAVIANNVANVNTHGFEADQTIFSKYNFKNHSNKTDFTIVGTTNKNDNPGPIINTNRVLDLAILQPNSYFKFITIDGKARYSLDGQFMFNEEGTLIHSTSGLAVASADGGIIVIEGNSNDVVINKAGEIFLEDEIIARIGAFSLEKGKIMKIGNNLFTTTGAENILDDHEILSGYLRGSNANQLKEMVELNEVQKNFTTATNMMKEIDQLEEKIVSKILNS